MIGSLTPIHFGHQVFLVSPPYHSMPLHSQRLSEARATMSKSWRPLSVFCYHCDTICQEYYITEPWIQYHQRDTTVLEETREQFIKGYKHFRMYESRVDASNDEANQRSLLEDWTEWTNWKQPYSPNWMSSIDSEGISTSRNPQTTTLQNHRANVLKVETVSFERRQRRKI